MMEDEEDVSSSSRRCSLSDVAIPEEQLTSSVVPSLGFIQPMPSVPNLKPPPPPPPAPPARMASLVFKDSEEYGESLYPDDSEVAPCESISRLQPSAPKRKMDVPSSSREKKRKWFEGLYGPSEEGPVKNILSRAPCRFFRSSGQCRNGASCPFLHESGEVELIEEPCRFMWHEKRIVACQKKDCKFSHDLSKFPCPFKAHKDHTGPPTERLKGRPRKNASCGVPDCPFSHAPLLTEKDKMSFVNMYRFFLKNSLRTQNPWWAEYLCDNIDERSIIRRALV